MSKKKLETTKGESNLVSNSRRRLIIATPPIILGMVNRPAWANMCSVSGSMSGPHSGQTEVECLGCTPGMWKANPDRWPIASEGNEIAGGVDPNTGECSPEAPGNPDHSTCKLWDNTGTKFGDVFCKSSVLLDSKLNWPDGSTGGADLSLMNVLWMGDKPIGNGSFLPALGAHIVAGLLNSAMFPDSYGYNVTGFIAMVDAALCDSNLPDGVLTLEEFKNLLDDMNNRGCPIDKNFVGPSYP